MVIFDYFSVLHPNIIVHVPSQDLDFQHHMLWSFLCSIFKMKHFFLDFVDIGGILDHHCLHFLFSMFFSVLFCVV